MELGRHARAGLLCDDDGQRDGRGHHPAVPRAAPELRPGDGAAAAAAATCTGFWQCKLRYSSQAEYQKRELPLAVIAIDFHHWVHDGDWRFSDDRQVPNHTTGCWPDPSAMVANLTAMGVKCAVSVWPDVSPQPINYANISAAKLLIRGEDGLPSPSVQGGFFVASFNPATRRYMFEQLMIGYGQHGIDIFWLDATEPEGVNIGRWYYQFDDGTVHHDSEVAMTWPQQYHRSVRASRTARHWQRRRTQDRHWQRRRTQDRPPPPSRAFRRFSPGRHLPGRSGTTRSCGRVCMGFLDLEIPVLVYSARCCVLPADVSVPLCFGLIGAFGGLAIDGARRHHVDL